MTADFTRCGDGAFRLEIPEVGVVLEVDRLRRKFEELIGELTVRCDLPGAQRVSSDGTLSIADLNLSSQRARQERAVHLAKRAQTDGQFDWVGLIERFCQRVIAEERAGQPAVRLRDLPMLAPEDAAMTIDGVPLLARHPLTIFGMGGALKSLMALYWVGRLALRGQAVLWADWEFDGSEHRARLQRIFGVDQMPERVYYVRCDRALTHEADRLRRLIRELAVTYLVIDSVAFATDGPPEAAESAASFFRALRSLDVGSLLIAHTTKAETGDQQPFGSIFWHNGSRSTWFIKRSEDTADASTVTVGLFHRKANTGPILAPTGYAVRFTNDQIEFSHADIARDDSLAVKLTCAQKMMSLLRRGPLTIAQIADEIGEKPETISRTVLRSRNRAFTRVGSTDGRERISLVERRTA